MISLDRIPAALACVATCALLSACAVGPDYQRPLVATPEQFRQEPGKVASIVLIGNLLSIVFVPLGLAIALPA